MRDTLFFRRIGAAEGDHSPSAALTPDDFASKAVLLVNVEFSSSVSNGNQLRQLEQLHRRYQASGLVVLGVPASSSSSSGDESEDDVLRHYQSEFGVSFPMASKQSLEGSLAHPFYVMLQDEFGGIATPQGSYHKTLLGRDGSVVGIYPPSMTPTDPEVVAGVAVALQHD